MHRLTSWRFALLVVWTGVTGIQITRPATESAEFDAYENIALECIDTKYNNLTWYKDNVEVISSIRHIMVHMGIKNSTDAVLYTGVTLVITDVTSYDDGLYRCQSRLNLDEQDYVSVTVKRAPVQIDGYRSNPLYVDAKFGLRLSCRAQEGVTLVWSKNYHTVGINNGYDQPTNQDRHLNTRRLLKNRPTEEDSGNYTCSNLHDDTELDWISVNITNVQDIPTRRPTYSTPPQEPVASATVNKMEVFALITSVVLLKLLSWSRL